MKPFMTIKELLYGLEKKQFRVEEIVDFYQKRIEKHNPTLNAFLELFDTESIKPEFYGDGPLAGIPGALKNNWSYAVSCRGYDIISQLINRNLLIS